MNQDNLFEMNKNRNILRASIPFLPPQMQQICSYYIRFQELQSLMQEFPIMPESDFSICQNDDTIPRQEATPANVIHAISPYLSKEELEFFHSYLRLIRAEQPDTCDNHSDTHTKTTADSKKNLQKEDETNQCSNLSQIMNLLTPEQKSSFMKYANLLGVQPS